LVPDRDGKAVHVRTASFRRRAVAGFGAFALLLTACNGGDEEAQPPPSTEPADEDGPDATEEPEEPDEPGEPDDTEEPSGPEDGDEIDDGTEILAGEPTTGPEEADGESGTLAVTDVRVATHGDFDRIVFETAGDGVPGWFVDFGEPTAQGSGEVVDVEGEAVLRVSIRMVTLPPDLPDDLEVWDGERLDGPAGGVVTEVVEDSIFEGYHDFFVGLDGERPFLVDRFDGPSRVVIDIPHDG
jgi:hypothetical protein